MKGKVVRRTAIALSAVALTATLGACSQGTDAAQPEQKTDTEQNGQEQGSNSPFNDASSLVSHVDSSIDKQQTVVMSIEMDGTNAMLPSMECEVDVAAASTSCTSEQMEVILTPEATFTKMPGLAGTIGKPWTKVSNSGGGPLSGNPAGSFHMATDFEKMLPPGASITNSSPEQLDGEETTRYEVVIDLNKAVAEASEAQRQLYQTALDAGVTETTTTVWIDADGLPTKVESVTPAMKAMGQEIPESTMRIDYKDWGKPVNIELPPADQVQAR